MKIVVLTKAAVPNVSTVKIDPRTGTLVREGVLAHVNSLDREAVELALRLKGRCGGAVIAISMPILALQYSNTPIMESLGTTERF